MEAESEDVHPESLGLSLLFVLLMGHRRGNYHGLLLFGLPPPLLFWKPSVMPQKLHSSRPSPHAEKPRRIHAGRAWLWRNSRNPYDFIGRTGYLWPEPQKSPLLGNAMILQRTNSLMVEPQTSRAGSYGQQPRKSTIRCWTESIACSLNK